MGVRLQAAVGSGLAARVAAGRVAARTSVAARFASQPVVDGVTTLALLKHVGAGLLVGTIAMVGAQSVYDSVSSSDSPEAEVVAQNATISSITAAASRPIPLIPPPPAAAMEAVEEVTALLDARAAELAAEQHASPTSASVPAGPAPQVPLEANARSPVQDGPSAATEQLGARADRGAQAPAGSQLGEPGAIASFPTLAATPTGGDGAARSPAPVSEGIKSERRLLAQARACLQRGEPVAALKVLRVYMSRFPQGELHGNAGLLRVEALLRAGQRQSALGLARDEIDRAPTRERLGRIRTLFNTRFIEESQGAPPQSVQ